MTASCEAAGKAAGGAVTCLQPWARSGHAAVAAWAAVRRQQLRQPLRPHPRGVASNARPVPPHTCELISTPPLWRVTLCKPFSFASCLFCPAFDARVPLNTTLLLHSSFDSYHPPRCSPACLPAAVPSCLPGCCSIQATAAAAQQFLRAGPLFNTCLGSPVHVTTCYKAL